MLAHMLHIGFTAAASWLPMRCFASHGHIALQSSSASCLYIMSNWSSLLAIAISSIGCLLVDIQLIILLSVIV